MIVVPIGFVSDHVEVVWDLDNEAAETAAKHGLFFARVRTPGHRPAVRRRAGRPGRGTARHSATPPPQVLPGAARRPDFCATRLLRQLPADQADDRRGRLRRGLGGHPDPRRSRRSDWRRPAFAGRRGDEPVTDRVLRVGTRGSALALAQSGAVAARIAESAGADSELVRIRTEGDVNTGPLAAIGGTGVFVTAVRTALADGRVDVIVHSFKDLPTAPAPRPDAGRGAQPGGPVRCAVRPGRPDAGQTAARRAGRHRITPPDRPTAAAPAGPAGGPRPRQRRHPAADGRPTAYWTPSCSPPPGSRGSGGPPPSPRRFTPD